MKRFKKRVILYSCALWIYFIGSGIFLIIIASEMMGPFQKVYLPYAGTVGREILTREDLFILCWITPLITIAFASQLILIAKYRQRIINEV